MPTETSAGGKRLSVLASGLHQLGARCGKVSAELVAEAAPPSVAASGWASSAGTTIRAAAAAGTDVSAIGQRIGTRGADYTKAATVYRDSEEGNAARLRGLVR